MNTGVSWEGKDSLCQIAWEGKDSLCRMAWEGKDSLCRINGLENSKTAKRIFALPTVAQAKACGSEMQMCCGMEFFDR